MTHDVLCPNAITNGVRSFWNDECPKCAVIAKARADERETAAMQVDLYLCSTFVEPRDHIVLYDRILNLIRTGQR